MALKLQYRLSLLIFLFLVFALRVIAQPSANFTVSSVSGCSPLTETFTNTSSGGKTPYSYVWELGNSNTSTLKDANAIYYTPGSYNITLYVTDAAGKTDSITQSITVFKNPVAKFSASTQAGCPPLITSFSDLSVPGSGSLTKWLWDFGDGNTSANQNPGNHTYTLPGKYTVSLLVTDANGCTASIIMPDYIYVDQPPSINFSASGTFGCEDPFKVDFTSFVSPASKNDLYRWNFGDGNTSTDANPSNTYTTTGYFNVSLSITDSLGCSTTKAKNQYIFIGIPVVGFSYTPSEGCSPLLVTFTNSTLGAPPGSTYSWNFGDGGVSTSQNPTHIYGPGSFNVTLIVKTPGIDACSDTLVRKDIIKVSKPYVPKYLGDTILCNPKYIATFRNETGPATTVVSWDFGDLKGGNGEIISHEYPDSFRPKYYTVTLTVVDTDGCVESVKGKVHTGPSIAAFSPNIFRACLPDTVRYKNLSTSIDKIIATNWDFGDGTTSNAFTPPPHVYTDTGQYRVTLNITTLNGCKSSFWGAAEIGIKPRANFISYPDSGCLNKLRHVHFFNLSNIGYKVWADSFRWNFGAGPIIDTLSDTNLDISFNGVPGKYFVTLIAYNNKGCPDTLNKKDLITITPPWAQYYPIRDTCALQNKVIFMDASIGATHVEYFFGDGDSSDQRNPTHYYTQTDSPQCFYPYQIAYDSSNHCSDTFNYYSPPFCLYLKPIWKDSIWPYKTDTIGCIPLKVVFKMMDNDTAANYISFGDGDSELVETPYQIFRNEWTDTVVVTHIYTRPGTYSVIMPAVDDWGCRKQDTMKAKIHVLGLKTVFSASPLQSCAPLTVTLIDSFPNDSGLIKGYYDMGNGDKINIISPKMTYTYTQPPADQKAGYKIVMLKSNISCQDTESTLVHVYFPSTQLFEFNLSNCDSVAYQFIPKTVGVGPIRYHWDFGNGDTSNGNQPTQTFPVGTYNIRLKVTDAEGCTDSLSLPVSVPSIKDSANFIIKVTQTKCPPATVNFTDESKFSTQGPHQWYWDFGDGSSSTLQNPSKVYYVPGTYTVTLKIKDLLGCTSTFTIVNAITINGPTGEYSFDPRTGCEPVTVHFTSKSNNATKIEWDYGDGSPFGKSDTSSHVYPNAGNFIPSLVLGDATCTYALPPIDTIRVHPLPSADFSYVSTCSGLPITFKDLSTSKTPIIHWVWDFGDGSSPDNRRNPTHIYKKNGFYPVTLSVATGYGCIGSEKKSVKYGDIIAEVGVPKTGCLGSPVHFKDLTISDSAIKSWFWDFGDGSSSTQENPSHTYTKKGIFPISLYAENYKGCYDSLKNAAYIIIGDTVPPKPPALYRVTVIDDHTAEIDFGKNTDFDFQKYVIYVKDETGNVKLLDEISDANDTIYFEKGLNNLHHSYCFMVQAVNVCDYKSDTLASMYHCTINLDAEAVVNAASLSWTPYVGWPVKQYKIYRQGAESPPQFYILDSVPGYQLKYIDTSVICYRTMVYQVEGIEQGGNQQLSWSDTAATIPIHVPHVPPGNMVRATVENNKTTLVEWEPVPNSHVKNWMLEKSADGINFNRIDTPICSVLSEADQKVNVQTTSYTYRLRILDSCGDLGPYSSIGKTILLNIDTNSDVKPKLVWTAYQDWPEGVKYYDIDIENGSNSFDFLTKTNSGMDTVFVDTITDLNSLPFYTYHVVAHRNGILSNPDRNINITSMSNDATLQPHSRLFIPNAFTPNGDGINDSFFVEGLYIKEFHMKIFDRWGTKVFESGSMKDKWSGRYKNGPPVLDAYKYLIYYRGVDNIDKYSIGWVTLLQ